MPVCDDWVIRNPIQILVEGSHDKPVFVDIVKCLAMSGDVDVQSGAGKTSCGEDLEVWATTDPFKQIVKAVVVVRDADDDPDAAFESVRDAFDGAKLPLPQAPFVANTSGGVVTGAAIMPDGSSSGALEALLLRTVSDMPHMQCVEEYMKCLAGKPKHPNYWNEDKAKAAVLLGGYFGDFKHIGTVGSFWDSKHPELQGIRDFIQEVHDAAI